MGKVIEFIPRPEAIPWRCAMMNCGSLLGIKHSGGVLVLKYKEIMYSVTGDYTVVGVCRKCGARSIIKNSTLDTLLKEED